MVYCPTLCQAPVPAGGIERFILTKNKKPQPGAKQLLQCNLSESKWTGIKKGHGDKVELKAVLDQHAQTIQKQKE